MARPKQPHLEVARPLQAAYGPEDERGAQLRAVGGQEGEEKTQRRERKETPNLSAGLVCRWELAPEFIHQA